MKKATYAFLIANLFGILLFLYFDHRIREFMRYEQRAHFDFGDSLNFLRTAFPVFLASVASCCVWCVASLMAAFRQRSFQESYAFCGVISAWMAILMITGHLRLIVDFPSLASIYLSSL